MNQIISKLISRRIEAEEDEEREANIISDVKRLQYDVLIRHRMKVSAASWIDFAHEGTLQHTEYLNYSFMQGSVVYQDKYPLQLQPYVNFVQYLLKEPGNYLAAMVVAFASRSSGEGKKWDIDRLLMIVSHFLCFSASSNASLTFIEQFLGEILAEDLSRYKSTKAYLEEQSLSRSILSQILRWMLLDPALLSYVLEVSQRILLDEQVDLSDGTNSAQEEKTTSLMYQEIFEAVFNGLQQLDDAKAFLAIVIKMFEESFEESDSKYLLQRILMEEQVIFFMSTAIASPLECQKFLSPNAFNNLQHMSRSFGASILKNQYLSQTFDRYLDEILSICSTNAEKTSNDFIVCLSTQDLGLLHKVFHDVWSSSPLPKSATKEFSRFLKLPILQSDPSTFFIISAIPQCTATKSPILSAPSSSIEYLCRTLSSVPLKYAEHISDEWHLGKAAEYIGKRIQKQLNYVKGQQWRKLSRVMLWMECLGDLDSIKVSIEDIVAWSDKQYETHCSLWKTRKMTLAKQKQLYKLKLELLDNTCEWLKNRIQITKAYQVLSELPFKFVHKIQIGPTKRTYLLEARDLHQLIQKFTHFVFGEALLDAEATKSGLGLKVVSDLFLHALADIHKMVQNHELMIVIGEDTSAFMETVEALLCRRLYPALYYAIISVRAKESIGSPRAISSEYFHDEVFANRLKLLQWVEPGHLDLDLPEMCESELKALCNRAGKELKRLEGWKTHTPKEKLTCLTKCYRTMSEGLVLVTKRPPDADSTFPGLIYVILKAFPKSLPSNLQFIRQFRPQERLIAEDNFCLTQFALAQSFIMNAGPQAFTNISIELWAEYMDL